MGTLKISGTGCSLLDYLFANVSFTSDAIRPFMSKRTGDGGLTPGALVFADEFESFAKTPFERALAILTGGRQPDAVNLGGPAIVALVNTAQLLHGLSAEVRFFGALGKDRAGDAIIDFIGRTPVLCPDRTRLTGLSPSTAVLSDPVYDHGHGERIFVNTLGAAALFDPSSLPASFFESDIALFGGTAIVPRLHAALPALLRKAKTEGAVTFVNTVYDFLAERRSPDTPWGLGGCDQSFRDIDLLITDHEEAIRITGRPSAREAAGHFLGQGAGAIIITHGATEILFASQDALFGPHPLQPFPVSARVTEELRTHPKKKGDTTGCGDNFAGGVLAGLALQMAEGKKEGLDPSRAIAWGAASGGFACFHLGGTFFENKPGEKLSLVRPICLDYCRQTGK